MCKKNIAHLPFMGSHKLSELRLYPARHLHTPGSPNDI